MKKFGTFLTTIGRVFEVQKPIPPTNTIPVPIVVSSEFAIRATGTVVGDAILSDVVDRKISDITLIDVVEDDPTMVRYVKATDVAVNSISYLQVGRYPLEGVPHGKHNRSKIGRLIGQLGQFTDPQKEEFVNIYRARASSTTNFALITGWEQIAHWYNLKNYVPKLGVYSSTLHNSCLGTAEANRFQIYADPTVSMLVLFDCDVSGGIPPTAKLTGRSMVWTALTVDGKPAPDGMRLVDRCYSHNQADVKRFDQYAFDHGWISGAAGNHNIIDSKGQYHSASYQIDRGPRHLTTPLGYGESFASKFENGNTYIFASDSGELLWAKIALKIGERPRRGPKGSSDYFVVGDRVRVLPEAKTLGKQLWNTSMDITIGKVGSVLGVGQYVTVRTGVGMAWNYPHRGLELVEGIVPE